MSKLVTVLGGLLGLTVLMQFGCSNPCEKLRDKVCAEVGDKHRACQDARRRAENPTDSDLEKCEATLKVGDLLGY